MSTDDYNPAQYETYLALDIAELDRLAEAYPGLSTIAVLDQTLEYLERNNHSLAVLREALLAEDKPGALDVATLITGVRQMTLQSIATIGDARRHLAGSR